jgi:hypothetical protein
MRNGARRCAQVCGHRAMRAVQSHSSGGAGWSGHLFLTGSIRFGKA